MLSVPNYCQKLKNLVKVPLIKHLTSPLSFARKLLKLCLLLSTAALHAQDLDNLKDKEPVHISGSLSGTSTFYHTDGPSQRDPFYWMLNGNITIDLYGIAIPISATLTQQNRSFTQPFNQYGLSPHYKAVTLHLGYRSMNFSDFTLAGNLFLGAGFEVAPDNAKVRFSGMYGRLVKPVQPGRLVDGVITGQPAYRRMGYAGKVSFGKNGNLLDFILFKGKDDENSINADTIENLSPAENLVLGFHAAQKLHERVKIDVQYAFSAYTTDTRQAKIEDRNFSYLNNFEPLFTPNGTSQYNNAISGNITYTDPLYQLKLSYRRIDPEFKTMGSVFLVNDIEDITGTASWRMFGNKLNLAATGGVQTNNLNEDKISQMKRGVYSFNASFVASEKLNMTANYSNFSSSTRFSEVLFLDSLNYIQVTKNTGASVNYNTGSEQLRHMVFVMANHQDVNDTQQNNSELYIINGGYQANFLPQDLSLTASLNFTNNTIIGLVSNAVGPTLGVSKSVFRKALRLNLTATYLRSATEGEVNSKFTNSRLGAQYRYGKHHSIRSIFTYLNRKSFGERAGTVNEIRAELSYAYTF